ncbi:amino acid ABC transporter permease [Mycolicibacterium sp. P1-18]|nr:amino acid ABC transporter permease [Mycolicibacterium sp. P1-18]
MIRRLARSPPVRDDAAHAQRVECGVRAGPRRSGRGHGLCPRRRDGAGQLDRRGVGRPVHQGPAAHPEEGVDHLRHRPAGVSALVRRRRPCQREGLRVGRRLCRRRQAGLRACGRDVGAGAVQRGHRPGPEDVRRQPQRVLHHRRTQAGRRLLLAVLRRHPGGRRAEVLPRRGGEGRRRPQGPQARRAGRHHQLHRREGGRPGRGGLQQQRRRQGGVVERSDRRAGAGSADGVPGPGRTRRRRHRRAVAGRRREGRAVRHRARQGQPADGVRVQGRRRAGYRRRTVQAAEDVAHRRRQRTGSVVTTAALDRVAYRQSRARRSTLIALVSTVVFAAVLLLAVTSSPGWPRVRESFFNLRIGWDSLPALLEGLWLNVRVLIVCQALILIFGLGLAAVRTLRGPVWFPLRALATGYVDLFRGLPLLICLYLVGFGLPGLRLTGLPNDPVLLGGLALVLIYSAYVAEVFRAGIESVHPSQLAAAKSLGLNHRRTMQLVVLPQATRRVTPALLNDFVALQKDCGLISVLGAVDAVRAAQIQAATTYNFTPYVVAGLLFVALAIPSARLADWAANRVATRQGAL